MHLRGLVIRSLEAMVCAVVLVRRPMELAAVAPTDPGTRCDHFLLGIGTCGQRWFVP
jgi:hypothetical protein